MSRPAGLGCLARGWGQSVIWLRSPTRSAETEAEQPPGRRAQRITSLFAIHVWQWRGTRPNVCFTVQRHRLHLSVCAHEHDSGFMCRLDHRRVSKPWLESWLGVWNEILSTIISCISFLCVCACVCGGEDWWRLGRPEATSKLHLSLSRGDEITDSKCLAYQA